MNDANFADAVLIVLGHGTDLNDQSAVPVRQHVAELRRRKIFADVREAFWKQQPHIKEVLSTVAAPRVFIAPLFVSEGYFADQVIPKSLGFDASRARREQSGMVWYCRPVGTHAHMTRVILSRALGVMKQFPFPRAPKPAETTLFIAGHGTEKNSKSREPVEQQVELIRAQQIFAGVEAIFMEEEPRIAGCHTLSKTKNCVVVPFFISDGLHVVEDIPVLLGEPERLVKERLAAGQPTWRNSSEKHGKLFWYSSAVGTDSGVADVILERVKEASNVAAVGT